MIPFRMICAAFCVASLAGAAAAQASEAKPTIVLVHGAFADSSSWNGVVAELRRDGYHVVAAANPLRSVASDAASVATVLRSIPGPVVLVGHSYGGSVISEAASGMSNVRALVFVSALAPDVGESTFGLNGKFPGSRLGEALAPVAWADGGHDLYIDQVKFQAAFAADVPSARAQLMASEQRPLTEAAGNESATAAAWKSIPSWWVYGTADQAVPPALEVYLAKRAHARETTAVKGASHGVMVSHPHEVAAVIEDAARAE